MLQNLILNLMVQKANIWYIKVEIILYITKMFFLNGEKVECVVTVDHLGHRLSTVDKSSMITAAESSFWKSFI